VEKIYEIGFAELRFAPVERSITSLWKWMRRAWYDFPLRSIYISLRSKLNLLKRKTMMKIYAIILTIILSFSLSAEELINEPFSTWLPDGWSVIEGPGGAYYSHWFHRDSQFATVFVTGDNQDEWLISPEIILPASGELELSVDMMGSYYRMVTMDWGDVYVYASNDGGINWDTIWKEDDEAMVVASGVSWPYGNNEWFFPSINLNTYAGQTINIAIRYVSPTGDSDWWNVDNFIVRSLNENDVALQQFIYPEYGIINDAFSFEGTFKNFGTNEVTSFEAIYTVNGVDSNPYLVDNISVPYNTTYTFTHDIPYTFASAEIFDLSLRVSKVNGSEDPLPDNNILYKDISIATEMLSRRPFFEVFTSSYCATCPLANEQIDEVLANNPGAYSLVKYQVYWPSPDPYYIVDDSIRAEYYNVGGVPDFYSNGVTESGYSFSQADFNAAANEGAYIDMNMYYYFNGTNITVDLDFTPTINILDAAVHIAIVEKTTYDNVGNNGETEFHNVLMKMLPGPEGNLFSLEEGVPVSITEAAGLSDTFIEEFDDLQVVAWVQDNETKYVLQSISSNLMVGVDEPSNLEYSIYPNPASNSIYMQSLDPGVIMFFDITGKLVMETDVEKGLNTYNVSALPTGLYFVTCISDKQNVNSFKMHKQ
jgi:hypothetical protein